ncbi:hypothetical protein Pint_22150 [Pistacia integerrima]|uniref:Uncharacterized protein n=1 Tax=Pistacia integerrima TaxID=434235 RepID=A0ACC0YN94_9ROSI|nr:hypothetical protein Pint_22150 [Pistacia integerrima]
MSLVPFIFFFLLFPYSGAKNTSVMNSDENIYEFCPPTKCSKNGPKIRFPFRLKTQSISCGLEGFEMSCSNDKTMLHLPFSSGYYVEDISYLDRSITIMDMHDTTRQIKSLLSLNLTNSRFSLFDDLYIQMPPSCRRYKTINASFPHWYQMIQIKKIVIVWKALDGCYDCEKLGNYCGFNTTSNSTFCFINQRKSTIRFLKVQCEITIMFFTLINLVVRYKFIQNFTFISYK